MDACLDYAPDHNGECTRCDESYAAHELALNALYAIARLIYETRTQANWTRSHVDPAADPYYLTLARDQILHAPPPQPLPPADADGHEP